jgi:hypothetical protein
MSSCAQSNSSPRSGAEPRSWIVPSIRAAVTLAGLAGTSWIVSSLPPRGSYSLTPAEEYLYLLLVGICGTLGAEVRSLAPLVFSIRLKESSPQDELLRAVSGALAATLLYYGVRGWFEDWLGLVMAGPFRVAGLACLTGLATATLPTIGGLSYRQLAGYLQRNLVQDFTLPEPLGGEPNSKRPGDLQPVAAAESLAVVHDEKAPTAGSAGLIGAVCRRELDRSWHCPVAFIRAVMLRLQMNDAAELSSSASVDELIAWLRSNPHWKRLARGDDSGAQQKACQGVLVVAALSQNELQSARGEAAIVVAGPLDPAHDRYPLAYWAGSLTGATAPDHLHMAFSPPVAGRPSHLERIEYFARSLPRGNGSTSVV